MKTRLLVALVASHATFCLAAEPSSLPRSHPEAQGVSSSALLRFVEALDTKIDGMHSVMVVRHGVVIAEGWWTPYDAESNHALYSLSKSFTSTAVGLAIAEGKLSLDDEVLKFFPDDAPAEPSNNLKSMRVHDLIRMSAGHQTEASLTPAATQPWTKIFLAHPVPHKPGTHFMYNTAATYMLSAIVQKVTGQTVLDYLRPRLFEPLGIAHPSWGTSPQGISLGGYGLSIRTEDIARFGQLYLQKGRWNGKQLVPATWVEAATARQTSNGSSPKSDWDQGYGYQFWRCRHGAFRGDGAFGQYCLVMPEQDTVVAITSGVKDMQAVLNVIWDELLPALASSAPLATDGAASAKLEKKLESLALKSPQGPATSATAANVVGKTYVFPANERKLESLTLEPGGTGDAATLTLKIGGSVQRFACGHATWRRSKAAFGPLANQPAAARGAWTGNDTFSATICFYETPFNVTYRLTFTGDRVKLESESNVSFGPTRQPPLEGKVK